MKKEMKIGDLIKVTFWRSAAEANKDPHYFTNAVDESMGIIVNEAQDPCLKQKLNASSKKIGYSHFNPTNYYRWALDLKICFLHYCSC